MESQSLHNQQEASKTSPKTTLSDEVVEIAGPSVRQKEREEREELQKTINMQDNALQECEVIYRSLGVRYYRNGFAFDNLRSAYMKQYIADAFHGDRPLHTRHFLGSWSILRWSITEATKLLADHTGPHSERVEEALKYMSHGNEMLRIMLRNFNTLDSYIRVAALSQRLISFEHSKEKAPSHGREWIFTFPETPKLIDAGLSLPAIWDSFAGEEEDEGFADGDPKAFRGQTTTVTDLVARISIRMDSHMQCAGF